MKTKNRLFCLLASLRLNFYKIFKSIQNKFITKYIFLIILSIFLAFIYFTVISKNNKHDSHTKKKSTLSSTMGVNTHEIKGLTNFASLKDFGVKVARDSLSWKFIEKEKGEYNFTSNGNENYDNFINNLSAYNIRPYLVLGNTNSIYNSNKALDTEKGTNAYVNWIVACVNRYKFKNIIWEIYNEPNNSGYWTPQRNSAKNYAYVLKKSAQKIKKIDPTGLVVAPALSGLNHKALQWLKQTFKYGILNYIDAISFHPYRNQEPESIIKDYDILRKTISKYTNKNIALFCGEMGYSSTPYWDKKGNTAVVNSDMKQAQYMVRLFLINQAEEIPVTIWYDWKDDGISYTDVEKNFGLNHYNKYPKDSGIAFKVLSRTLGDYRYVSRINIGNKDDYLLKYKNSDFKIAYAFWTTKGKHTFVLNKFIDGETTSMLGNKKKIKGKKLKINISESPTYLVTK